MKKTLYTILALMFCVGALLCLGSAAWAETYSGTWGDYLSWTLDDTGLLTVSGSGGMPRASRITEIPWYNYSDSIRSVVIGSNLLNISEHAFENCTMLESVTIPDGVLEIDRKAFGACISLTEITIPASVTNIHYSAFDLCSALTAIDVASSNTVYSSADGVLFRNGGETLFRCPEGKTGTYAIPSGVTSIDDYAFHFCDSLTSVTIPAGVTEIGDYAFDCCSSLESVTISEGVTSIGEAAFYGCSGLTSVTIPSSVTSIDNSAFFGCDSLTSVTFTGTQAEWNSISIGRDNEALTNADVHCITPDFVLPAALTEIGEEAFQGGAFTFVKLPENAVAIGPRAFEDCPNLAYIYIPAAVTDIDANAFADVTGLAIIGAPNSTVATYAQQHGFGFVPAATASE